MYLEARTSSIISQKYVEKRKKSDGQKQYSEAPVVLSLLHESFQQLTYDAEFKWTKDTKSYKWDDIFASPLKYLNIL